MEKLAQQVLTDGGARRAPVDVEQIARKRGYRVVFERFPNADLSGVFRDDSGVGTIGINSIHHPVRQRFSIAHEIGHAELHASKGRDGVVFIDPPGTHRMNRDELSSRGDDAREIEANQFAAALLMPQPLVFSVGRNIVKRDSSISVDQLVTAMADKFEVSEQAMRLRLVNLGIVEPT